MNQLLINPQDMLFVNFFQWIEVFQKEIQRER